MPNLYPIARYGFGLLSPETARDLTVWCLEHGLGRFMVNDDAREPDSQVLAQTVWGLHFSNPVGLAAGFDKDARVPDEVLDSWRFGFVEVGTITPRSQFGNDKPRVFRLKKDRAIINRMGFNSCGLEVTVERLQNRSERSGIVGVNLGKNRDAVDAISDYREGIRRTANLASYIVVNVSSPNTPGLRDLQRRAPLTALLSELVATRDEINPHVPLLIKIAPDLMADEIEDIVSVVLNSGINGIIVSNTTIDRPVHLTGRSKQEQGGLSGQPLFEKSTQLLARISVLTEGRLPLIGVGGISDGFDAFEKICAGASLVQLYTSVALGGPTLVTNLKRELASILKANGFSSVAEAVGTKNAAWAEGRATAPPRARSVQLELKPGIISRAKRRRLSRDPCPLSNM